MGSKGCQRAHRIKRQAELGHAHGDVLLQSCPSRIPGSSGSSEAVGGAGIAWRMAW